MANSVLTVIFGGKDQGLMGMINQASSSLSRLQQTGNQAQTSMNNLANSASKALKSIQDTAHQVFASIRQIGQGLQNLGVTFSVFFSFPAAKLLQGITTEAIAFQDELIQTRKTAGLTNSELARLGPILTEISLATSTSRVDLAKMATAWGQAGIESVDAIGRLVESSDKMVLATNITADDVVEKMGRIGNIVYDTTQDFVDNFEKMGSMVNELADANVVSESEIVNAWVRMAAAGEALGLTIEEQAALSTTAAATNASAERAGTQLAAALTSLVKKYGDLAVAVGKSDEEIKNMINTDPGGFMVDLIASISQVEDRVDRLKILDEIFGGVGGKTAGALGAALPTLAKNLDIANKAYEEGISLQQQYEKALDSVKNQLGLLSNNFRYLGSIIGEEFLPYITQASALLISAVQLLIASLKQLEEINPELASKIKLTVAAFIGFVAIIGPIITILGTFLFSLGIVGTGIVNLAGVFAGIIPTIIRFGGVILALLNPFKLVIAAVVAFGLIGYYIAQQLGEANSVVQHYINLAYNWGFNLMTSFGTGIYNAASYVYNAIVSVINSFIGLLRAFSPPREGPLKDIDKWGATLMKTYADAFAGGDMSGIEVGAANIGNILRSMLETFDVGVLNRFKDAFGSIRSVIQAVGGALGVETSQINDWIKRAALVVSEFVSNVENGVSASLEPISDILGGLAGDFDLLIRLQTQYADQSERLQDIEDALNGINDASDEQIKSIMARNDLSVEQQAALIRQAKLTGSLERQRLENEKQQIESGLTSLEDEISKRQDIIELLSSLIFDREESTGSGGSSEGGVDDIDKPPKEKKPKAGEEGPTPFELTSLEESLGQTVGLTEELGTQFDKAGGKVETFIGKIQRAKSVVEGFIAGIRGDDKASWVDMPEEFWKGFEAGQNIRTTVLDFLTKVDNFKLKLAEVGGAFAKGFDAAKAGADAGYFGILNPDALSKFGQLETALFKVGYFAGAALKHIAGFFAAIQNSVFGKDSGGISNFDRFVEQLQAIKDAMVFNFDPDGSLQNKLSGVATSIKSIAQFIGAVALGFGAIALFVFDNLDELSGALSTIAGLSFDFVLDLINVVGALAQLVLIALGHGSVDDLATSLGALNDKLAPWAGTLATAATKFGEFVTLMGQITGAILTGTTTDELDASLEKINKYSGIKDVIASNFQNVDAAKDTISKIIELRDKLVELFTSGSTEQSDGTVELESFLKGFIGTANQLKIGTYIASAIDFEKINQIIDVLSAILDAFKGRKTDAADTQEVSSQLNLSLGAIAAGLTFFAELKVTEFVNRVYAFIDAIDALFGLTDKHKGKNLAQRLAAVIVGENNTGVEKWILEQIIPDLKKEDVKNAMPEEQEKVIAEGINEWIQSLFSGSGSGAVSGRVPVNIGEFELGTAPLMTTGTSPGVGMSSALAGVLARGIQDAVAQVPTMGEFTTAMTTMGTNIRTGFETAWTVATSWMELARILWSGFTLAVADGQAKANIFMQEVGGYLKTGFVTFWEGAANVTAVALALWSGIFKAIIAKKDAIIASGQDMGMHLRDGISKFFGMIENVGRVIKEFLSGFGSWVKSNTKEIYNNVSGFATELIKQIGEAIKNAPNAFGDIIKGLINDALAGIGLPGLVQESALNNTGQTGTFQQTSFMSDGPMPVATEMELDATGWEAGITSVFSSLGSSAIVEASRITFMSNLVIKMMEDFGFFMTMASTAASGATSINSFLTLVASTGFIFFTLRGYDIATIVRDGMQLFFSIINIAPVLTAMVTAISGWTDANISQLNELGKKISEHIREGMRARFAEDAEYMVDMLSAIGSWISSNVTKLAGLGGDIGESIVDGINDYITSDEAIADMADAIIYAMEKARELAESQVDEVNSASIPTTHSFDTPSTGFTITPAYAPRPTSEGNTQDLVVNVYIQGDKNDKKIGQKIGEDVYKKLTRDFRVASAGA